MKVWEIFGVDKPVNSCTPSEVMCSDSMIGIEHELEGARGSDFQQEFTEWNAIQDGSLRNGGIEYVLKRPLSGQQLVDAITALDTYVQTRPNIVANERTSTHIHVDVRDLTTQQLLMFFVVYTTYEQVLFAMCDESRVENNFCVPVRKNGGVIKRMRDLVQHPESTRVIHRLGNSNYRYAAMNMASLPRFGSLEFRMRETLTNANELIDWINILISLKQFAIEHGNDPVTDAVTRFNTLPPVELTNFIFGEELSLKLQATGCLDMHVADGAELASHIFHNEDDSLDEVARSCEVCDPTDDQLCKMAEMYGMRKASYVSRIFRDKDPRYTYPPMDWSAATFKLQSGASSWWSENIKKARVITDRDISLETLLSMKATLSKGSVRNRTGINIEDLLDSRSRQQYWDYMADTTPPATQSSVNHDFNYSLGA